MTDMWTFTLSETGASLASSSWRIDRLNAKKPKPEPQIGYCPIHKTQYISDNCVICTKPWEQTK